MAEPHECSEKAAMHTEASDIVAETHAWAERWLSADRLKPYLVAAGGNIEAALDLYEWNIGLGQVLMRDISHFEVALRNTYDSLMRERWDGSAHWLLDDASPVRKPIMRTSQSGELDANRINRKIIDSAVDGLPAGFGAGALVANLTLGFWVHLTDRSREMDLWRTNLYLAWPRGTNRAKLQRSLSAILRVRNRVAHAERLFDPSRNELSPLAVDADLVRLLHDLCPEAHARLHGRRGETPVERFCRETPTPASVRL